MENPIKMDDLGVSLFLETPICTSYYVYPKVTPQVSNLTSIQVVLQGIFFKTALLPVLSPCRRKAKARRQLRIA